ncbi:uncharacterized protein LOC144660924 [Oculina patagonica]
MAYFALRNIRFSRGAMRNCRKRETNFPVIYLGSVQILCPIGEGICGSVEEIFENCQIKLKHNLLPKKSLQVKDDSFELDMCKSDEEYHGAKTVYKFNRIIYCGVDGKRRKILVFNYHHGEGEGERYLSDAGFFCENKSAAKKLAFAVAEYFQQVKFVGAQDVDDTENEKPQMKTKLTALKRKKHNRNNKTNSCNSETELELGKVRLKQNF